MQKDQSKPMEFNEQEANLNSIVSLENNKVNLSHTQLSTPCFISKSFHSNIEIKTTEDISPKSVFPLLNQDDINLLIVGTGVKPVFLSAKQTIALQQIGLGVETMNSDSACRSFNLLLSDARPVGILLL